MNSNLQEALLESLQEIQVREQVKACLDDLLVDIELAATLENQIYDLNEICTLESEVKHHEVALAETRELQRLEKEHQKLMADSLLKELLVMSKELGELKEIKQRHNELLVQHDEVVAKLFQAEENLHNVREQREQAPERSAPAPASDTAAETSVDTDAEPPSESPVKASETISNDDAEDSPDTTLEDSKPAAVPSPPIPEAPTSEATETDGDMNVKDVADEPPKDPLPEDKVPEPVTDEDSKADESSPKEKDVEPPVPEPEPEPAPEPVVALVEDDEDDGTEFKGFDRLETEVIMKIFAFLDAMDILNVAQTSVRMYSRVDTLFGLGTEAEEDNSTIRTNEAESFTAEPTIVAMPPANTASSSTTQPTVATQPTIVTQPTVATIPAKTPAPKKPPSHTPSKSVDSAASSASRGAAGLFSMLQPRARQPQPQRPSPGSPARKEANSGGIPLNAAMANSMASKLSDAELNAIILMTERLKEKETLATSLSKENEDLSAKLEGVERVKEFLISKVRDMETSISSSVENEIKVAQQIASDQEVIAFLDGRVQDLEREAKILRKDKVASDQSFGQLRQQLNEKASVMGDMLEFERGKVRDSERQWKAKKKLLVKEVKNCRAQIVALQAERDGYYEQVERLQQHADVNDQNGTSNHDRGFGL